MQIEADIDKRLHKLYGIQYWDDAFWKKAPVYQELEPHKHLVKYYNKLFPRGPRDRVFLPLCGKTVDMRWLAERGHQVVGVEGSEIGVTSFFREQRLKYSKRVCLDSKLELYKADDLDISIYKGDIFDTRVEILGKFDAIWDRAAFHTIFPEMRIRYLELMKSIMNENCTFLLSVVGFDSPYQGPPYDMNEAVLESSLGKCFNYEFLESYDQPREGKWFEERDIQVTQEILYEVTRKEDP